MLNLNKMKKTYLVIISVLLLASCAPKEENKYSNSKSEPLKIVCTTNIVGDLVNNIVGDKATVKTLMGAGVDPHLYKATQGDIKDLMNADVIVYSGLHLEGKMGEIFEKLSKQKVTIAVSDGIDKSKLINSSNFQGAYDPHIWFDPTMWADGCIFVSEQLAKADTNNRESFTASGKSYANNLMAVSTYISEQVNRLPKDKRIMITAHDAFSYYGRAYDIEVKGLQGISTMSEYGLKDVTNMVNFIIDNKIKAVFVETSVNKRSIEAVIEGCKEKGYDLKIGGDLFSDAMGERGKKGGNYVDMIKSNTFTIVNALK